MGCDTGMVFLFEFELPPTTFRHVAWLAAVDFILIDESGANSFHTPLQC